jgi:tetratricopeptide (TPR) repeat protein
VIARGAEHDDRQSALAMAATLVWFWYVHSHFTEGNYWSSRLLDDRQEAPSRALVRLLIGAGDFDFRIGEHHRAAARFGEALRGARRLGSESLAMWALAYMATNDALCLRLDEACISLEKAAAIADESGDFLAAGYCTFMDASVRGWMAIQDDEPELLPPLLEKLDMLAGLVRTAGERNMIGHVLQAVGLMAHWVGREEQARGALEESLTAFAEINTKGCASHCLEAVALAVAETHPSVAVELLAGSDSIRQRLGIKAPPLEQELRTLATESARAFLATDDLDAAGERGRDPTLAEATALARQVLAEPLSV